MMRAAVYRKYGPPEVVQIERLPIPQPKDDELLIRVHASTVSAADWRIRSLELPTGFGLFGRPAFGMFGPRKQVLGTELAGFVQAVGKSVSKFAVGDRVFGYPGVDLGCHAEFRVLSESGKVAHMPAGSDFAQAASISFGGSTALHFLRDAARLRQGEKVLVIGASGTVGSAAVQLARFFGARVTATTSTANLGLVAALGAECVIDYTQSNILDVERGFDVIFDAVGLTSLSQCKGLLNDAGRLILCAGSVPQILGSYASALGRKQQVLASPASESVEQLHWLKERVEAGDFKPLVDRCYPLECIAEAHAYVASGRKRGSVVITMT